MTVDSNAQVLMRRFQNGEEEAFDQLYVLYKNALYAFLFRFSRDEQLSIDLVQDSFLKLHQYKNHYDENKASIKTYLFQIAYNLLLNKIKRRQKWKKLLPFLVPQTEFKIASEERITIKEAVMNLPDSQRAIVLLSYYHGLTQTEIASIINIPVGTVKSRLHTAMKILRKQLEEDYDERHQAE